MRQGRVRREQRPLQGPDLPEQPGLAHLHLPHRAGGLRRVCEGPALQRHVQRPEPVVERSQLHGLRAQRRGHARVLPAPRRRQPAAAIARVHAPVHTLPHREGLHSARCLRAEEAGAEPQPGRHHHRHRLAARRTGHPQRRGARHRDGPQRLQRQGLRALEGHDTARGDRLRPRQ